MDNTLPNKITCKQSQYMVAKPHRRLVAWFTFLLLLFSSHTTQAMFYDELCEVFGSLANSSAIDSPELKVKLALSKWETDYALRGRQKDHLLVLIQETYDDFSHKQMGGSQADTASLIDEVMYTRQQDARSHIKSSLAKLEEQAQVAQEKLRAIETVENSFNPEELDADILTLGISDLTRQWGLLKIQLKGLEAKKASMQDWQRRFNKLKQQEDSLGPELLITRSDRYETFHAWISAFREAQLGCSKVQKGMIASMECLMQEFQEHDHSAKPENEQSGIRRSPRASWDVREGLPQAIGALKQKVATEIRNKEVEEIKEILKGHLSTLIEKREKKERIEKAKEVLQAHFTLQQKKKRAEKIKKGLEGYFMNQVAIAKESDNEKELIQEPASNWKLQLSKPQLRQTLLFILVYFGFIDWLMARLPKATKEVTAKATEALPSSASQNEKQASHEVAAAMILYL